MKSILESKIKKGGLHGLPKVPKPCIRPRSQKVTKRQKVQVTTIIHQPVDKDRLEEEARAKKAIRVKVYKTTAVYNALIPTDNAHPDKHDINEARERAVEMVTKGELKAEMPDCGYLTMAY